MEFQGSCSRCQIFTGKNRLGELCVGTEFVCRRPWMRLFCFRILLLRLELDSTGTVGIFFSFLFSQSHFMTPLLDWAYLEDWCRRLTGSFADVYVFTIPLYLPKLEADGKWRVVIDSTLLLKYIDFINIHFVRLTKSLALLPTWRSQPILLKSFSRQNHHHHPHQIYLSCPQGHLFSLTQSYQTRHL